MGTTRNKLVSFSVKQLFVILLALIMVLTMLTPISSLAFADQPSAEEALVLSGSEESEDPEDTAELLGLDQQDPEASELLTPQTETSPDLGLSDQDKSAQDVSAQAVQTFAINITPSASGTVATNIPEAQAGNTVIMSIVADSGYELKPGSLKVLTDSQQAPRLVRGLGSEASPYTFVMPSDSVTVTAEFVKVSAITIASNIEHGKISTDVQNAVVGNTITITVTPDEGYRLKFNSVTNQPRKTLRATYGPSNTEVTIPDSSYDVVTNINTDLNVAATEYTFTMPASDVTVTAEFTRAYALKADSAITNGNISYAGRTVAGEGERVPVAAVANGGYQYIDGTFKLTDSQDKEVTFNSTYGEFMMPTSDVSATARFEVLPKLLGSNFQVTPGDSEFTCSWNSVGGIYTQRWVFYREKDSTDAYKGMIHSTGVYDGTLISLTATGVRNDVEYEVYLQVGGSATDMFFVTPTVIAPTGVTLTQSSVDIVLGQTVQLVAAVAPAETKAQGVTWTSSDEAVALVGLHGKIETTGLGTATITATTDVGELTATCQVNVVQSKTSPSGGSMIIGPGTGSYNASGGTATVPFTVTIPTDRPVFHADFTFNFTSTYGQITGIALDGTNLNGYAINTVGDSKIYITNLPAATYVYDSWASITPTAGEFLEAGRTYNFTLTVSLRNSVLPVVPVNYNNTTNYTGFYYYDYDTSPAGGSRADPEVRQIGTIRSAWTGDGVPSNGSGDNTNYLISTAEQLIWYVDLINSGTKANVTLYADIDLTNTSFNGIGSAASPYGSRFNGNGYAVTYNLTQSTDGPVGFIRSITGGLVSSLTTKGVITVTGGNVNVGGVVGQINDTGQIAGCNNQVSISVTGGAGGNIGGIVGQTSGNVSSNTNLGAIIASGSGVLAAGGIAGYVTNGIINGNGNGGTNRQTAGVSGTGSVTGRGYVGGIVGLSTNTDTGNIYDNTNFATITGLSGEAVAGIAGKVTNANIGGTSASSNRTDSSNRNYGSVNAATTYAAGIVAYLDAAASERVALNYNEGTISSTSTASGAALGGTIARLSGSTTVAVADNINIGTLTAGSGVTKGGVLGKSDVTLSEELCTGNYYAFVEGLGDAAYSATALASWLSLNGYFPAYSGTGGDGSAADPYQIINLDDFFWFTRQVNLYGKDYSVILATDIDLSEYPDFEGIGSDAHHYAGIFDGDNHKVIFALDGFSAGGQAYGGQMALFRRCFDATIKNLVTEGNVVGVSVAGVALNFNRGTMENVHNYADVSNTHDTTTHGSGPQGQAAGVIVGSSPSLMQNVTNHGTIYGHNAAGIALGVISGTVIDGCVNYGNVTACMLAAGIVGGLGVGEKSTDGTASFIIRNTSNEGTITSLAPTVLDDVAWFNNGDLSTNHTAAGIVGNIGSVIVEINNVTNNGLVQGSGNNIGGILGTSSNGDYMDTDFRIINSTNNGTVQSTYNGDDPRYLSHISVGGIVGNTAGTFGPSNVWNPNGSVGNTQNATVTGSTNNGQVIGPDGTNVGAIIGLISGNESSHINVGNNFTTVVVDESGRNPVKGDYYNPETHKVVDGKIVEKYPVIDDPRLPNNQNNPTNTNTNTSASVAVEPTVGVPIDGEDVSTAAIVPPSNTATPPTIINPTDTPTADPSSSGPRSNPTFFEIVTETVANNPVAVVAIIIAAAAMAFAGGIWRYRRNVSAK